jgi:hypothetical protein
MVDFRFCSWAFNEEGESALWFSVNQARYGEKSRRKVRLPAAPGTSGRAALGRRFSTSSDTLPVRSVGKKCGPCISKRAFEGTRTS